MAGENGNGLPSSRLSFTLSQLIQFIGLVLAGAMMWGNLKGDIRVGFANVANDLKDQDRRISTLERHDERRLRGR